MFALALTSNTTFACLHFSSFACQETVCYLSTFVRESSNYYHICHCWTGDMCQPILLVSASARIWQSSSGCRFDMAPHVARFVKSENACPTCPRPLRTKSWHELDGRNPKRNQAEAYCQLSAEYDLALGEVPEFVLDLNFILKKEERRYSVNF